MVGSGKTVLAVLILKILCGILRLFIRSSMIDDLMHFYYNTLEGVIGNLRYPFLIPHLHELKTNHPRKYRTILSDDPRNILRLLVPISSRKKHVHNVTYRKIDKLSRINLQW